MTTKEELRALDAQVAELRGYRRIEGPRTDYDGPVAYGDVLIPPELTNDAAYRAMPPRGSIPLTYFVREYSKDELEALALVHWMHKQIPLERAHWYNYVVIVCTGGTTGWAVSFDFNLDTEWYEHPADYPFAARGDTLPVAICRSIVRTLTARPK